MPQPREIGSARRVKLVVLPILLRRLLPSKYRVVRLDGNDEVASARPASRLAVGECLQRVAHSLPAAGAQRTQSNCQHRLRYGREVVERHDAFVVDPSSRPTAMQVGIVRIVLVTGATTMLLSTGIAASRETMRTGRAWAFGGSISHSSP